MSNAEHKQPVIGKITATPNPVPLGISRVAISWESNDCDAEVRVSTGRGKEQLLSKGASGQTEISWIASGIVYEFRLYSANQPPIVLDSVRVTRDVDLTELSQFIADMLPLCLYSRRIREFFPVWEKRGFHVTPVHFYQPIPDTQKLAPSLWDKPSELRGIDMNDAGQLRLLRNDFSKFRSEYERFPNSSRHDQNRFYLNNGRFDGIDALIAYCMVRHFRPRSILEIGSGMSSLLLIEAAEKNGDAILTCVDPFPSERIRRGFSQLRSVIQKEAQDVDLEFFAQLDSNDILFIDSSHTVKIGSDVNYLFLEVLPRLKPGVIVHVHDIFFPFEYRRDWVLEQFRFWTEQYLLQAFLAFNSEFEVLMASNYLAYRYKEDLKLAFSTLSIWGGGSLWIQRRLPKQ